MRDHGAAIECVLKGGRLGEVYNIGGHNEWKNIDIVQLVCDILDEKLGRAPGTNRKLITFVKDRPGHDRRYAIDAGKIERELGWRPAYTFERGIAETIDWYLANQAWVAEVTSGAYRDYYKRFDKTYHVQLQLESLLFKGKSIPSVAGLVDAMFMAEMKDWLLTAGHDLDSLQLPLRLEATTGVTGWRLHDLRRTTRTLLSRAGVASDVAEMCLGHVLPGVVRQIYDRHQYEKEKAQAYERLATLIASIVNPSDTVVPMRRTSPAAPGARASPSRRTRTALRVRSSGSPGPTPMPKNVPMLVIGPLSLPLWS